jgi:hypothetical protein
MRTFSTTFKVVLCAVFMLALTSVAQAQATRTWVSGVGDDVNPCSRTAPCKTFAGAISKTFIGGEIDALDPGGFGTVTVTKSITLDGASGFGSILASGTNGVNINIAANANDPQRRVTLRRLSINGTGSSGAIGTSTGIRGVNVNTNGLTALDVENCYIQNFTTVGIDLAQTAATSPIVSIKDTNVTNTGTGIQMTTGSGGVLTAVLDKVRVEFGANGIIAKDRAFITVRDSVVQGPGTGTGLSISAPSNVAGLNLEGVVVFNWNIGVAAGAGASRVDLSNSSLLNNTTAITSGGGATSINSHGNNVIAGGAVGQTPNPVGQQ